MDKSGTSSHRPVVLVIEQIHQMEKLIRAGILACPCQVDFCPPEHKQVLQEILISRPTLIIAPLQLENINVVQLEQEIMQKTGEPVPGIFFQDPNLAELEKLLAALVKNIDFLPKQFLMQDLNQKVERMASGLSQKREYRSDAFMTPVERKKTTVA